MNEKNDDEEKRYYDTTCVVIINMEYVIVFSTDSLMQTTGIYNFDFLNSLPQCMPCIFSMSEIFWAGKNIRQ